MLAPAKVNLFLDILRRRDDGYHDLRTVFAAISLCDEINVSFRIDDGPRLDVDGPFADGVPTDASNLAMKAALRVIEQLPTEEERAARRRSLHIALTKNIPHGAGLGGGSSNAATALRATAQALNLFIEEERLYSIAASLGSDCAFFLAGGYALGEGRGELLSPMPGRSLPVALIIPDFSVSTKEAYGALRSENLGERSDLEGLRRWLKDSTAPLPHLENSFEAALNQRHPALREHREFLRKHGATIAMLSGSGSATYGIFDCIDKRDAAIREGASAGLRIVAAETIPA